MISSRTRILAPSLDLAGLLRASLQPCPASSVSPAANPDWSPRTDIVEHADRFSVALDLPGVDPASIAVEFKDGMLTVSGERRGPELSESDRLVASARPSGKFRRTFNLSETIDHDGIQANSEHGVLTLSLPKRAPVEPHRIQVQAS